jgi:hypothetical protein
MIALTTFRFAELESRLADLDAKLDMVSQQISEATASTARSPEPQVAAAPPPAAPLPQSQLPTVIKPR